MPESTQLENKGESCTSPQTNHKPFHKLTFIDWRQSSIFIATTLRQYDFCSEDSKSAPKRQHTEVTATQTTANSILFFKF